MTRVRYRLRVRPTRSRSTLPIDGVLYSVLAVLARPSHADDLCPIGGIGCAVIEGTLTCTRGHEDEGGPKGVVMRCIGGFLLGCSILLGTAATTLTWAQTPGEKAQVAQAQGGKGQKLAPTAAASGEHGHVAKINEWTVGIAGGPVDSTLLRFVAEMAIALNEEDTLRVLPIVSAGSVGNATDLLYLRGIDLAMTTSDALNEIERTRNVANIGRRINYIAPMYTVELNVLARPEIQSLKDLEGKKVGFHVKGAATTVTGRILFERLGIKVEPVYINNSVAYEKMKAGELAALLHPGGKPNDFLLKLKVEPGFHLLPVEYEKFQDLYLPSTLTSEDYPSLIKPGEKIETVAIVALLAVYNWPQDSYRYPRVARFVESFITKFENLTKPPFHAKWREVNLWGKVPGWTRYAVADQVLARIAAEKSQTASTGAPPPQIDETLARQQAGRAAPGNTAEQDRLFQKFLEWTRQQQKR